MAVPCAQCGNNLARVIGTRQGWHCRKCKETVFDEEKAKSDALKVEPDSPPRDSGRRVIGNVIVPGPDEEIRVIELKPRPGWELVVDRVLEGSVEALKDGKLFEEALRLGEIAGEEFELDAEHEPYFSNEPLPESVLIDIERRRSEGG